MPTQAEQVSFVIAVLNMGAQRWPLTRRIAKKNNTNSTYLPELCASCDGKEKRHKGGCYSKEHSYAQIDEAVAVGIKNSSKKEKN